MCGSLKEPNWSLCCILLLSSFFCSTYKHVFFFPCKTCHVLYSATFLFTLFSIVRRDKNTYVQIYMLVPSSLLVNMHLCPGPLLRFWMAVMLDMVYPCLWIFCYLSSFFTTHVGPIITSILLFKNSPLITR